MGLYPFSHAKSRLLLGLVMAVRKLTNPLTTQLLFQSLSELNLTLSNRLLFISWRPELLLLLLLDASHSEVLGL